MREQVRAAQRRKRLTRYFVRTPHARELRRAVTLMALGPLVLSAALPLVVLGGFVAVTASLFLAAVGVATGFRGLELRGRYAEHLAAAEPKPTDREIDDHLAQDLVNARERAMRRLDLTDDEIELRGAIPDPVAALTGDDLAARREGVPLVVYGPGRTRHAIRAGDGEWRFGAYEVMVVCPTDRHLALYVCAIDFLTGGLTFEETYEYHYVDIVAVRTTTRPDEELAVSYLDRRQDDEVQFARTLLRTFQIIVSSGDRAAVTVGMVDEDHPDHEEIGRRVDIDAVVSAVRQLLRDKKSGPAPPTSILG